MRIAYVFDQVLPSSATDTEQVLNTVAALGRHGADVTLVLPRGLGAEPPDADALRDYYQVEGPFRVLRLDSYPPGRLRLGEKVGHAARAMADRRLRAFDIVYTRNVPSLLGGVMARHPVVYETYRPWPDQRRLVRPAFRAAMSRPNFLGGVFHSQFASDCYLRLGVPAEKLAVVHNGYDPRRFDPPTPRDDARRTLGLALDGPLVTYTGRVTLAKGLGIVLEMARQNPEVRFLFVGSERIGEFETQAAALPNVEVRGWARFDELPTYLFASDVLVIPPSVAPLESVGNTVLPMKLFLYLAAGRAILAPRSPDTAELLAHDRNAWLVPADDPGAAAAAIAKLTADPTLAKRLGQAARDDAAALTWDARAVRLLEVLERWLADSGAR
ncbi:MAG: glycosyltransferase [Myxococcota bacterium]